MPKEHSPITVPAAPQTLVLDGDALARLKNSLRDAFDLDGLTQLVRIQLNPDLAAVVPVHGRTLDEITYDLVLWALHNPDIGLQGLLAAARRANPDNPELKDLDQRWKHVTFAPPACPYPGMRPFMSEEQARFFGRTPEVLDAVDKLRRHRFLAIIGPSGSGKSSLLNAGILPALEQSHFFEGKTWAVRKVRPTEFAEHGFGRVSTVTGAEQVVGTKTGQRQLIVVDPLEELYTPAFSTDQRKAFEQAVLDKIADPELTVILAFRADFYANLMASPLWPAIRDRKLELAPLRGAALREAIVQPARDVGVELDAALVERLLADAGEEPGALPFVQETLIMLWTFAKDSLRIDLNHYTDLVGDKSGRSGLQVALAKHADEVYTGKLTDNNEWAIAQRILLRLVQFGEGRPDMRRQQTLAQLRQGMENQPTFDRVLEVLTANRLLTLTDSASDEVRRVDLAHEALIAGWPLLRKWIDARRSAEITRRRLEEKAHEREAYRKQKSDGGLLDAVELAEAQAWINSTDAAELGVSPQLRTMVEDSRKEIRKTALMQRSLIALLFAAMAVALIYMGRQLLDVHATILLNDSIAAAKNGHRDSAISLYKQAITENPRLPITAETAVTGTIRTTATELVRKGEEMAREGNPTGAVENFKKASDLNPPSDTLMYVYIDPGSVTLGTSSDQVKTIKGQNDESLQDMTLPTLTSMMPINNGFWIMRTEVTYDEYADCIKAKWCPEPQSTYADYEKGGFAKRPVANVTLEDAEAYAAWVGGRLPTPEEWEYACKGSSDNRIYSWGDQKPTVQRLNYDEAKWNTSLDVGTFPPGANGLYDMAGNLAEWTNSAERPGVVKSSAFSEQREHLTCAWGLATTDPSDEIGFRVIITTR